MLRPFYIVFLLTLMAIDAWPQATDVVKPSIQNWTLADGTSFDAFLSATKDDQVRLLVRTTVPIAAFDASSKARITTLSELPPEELLKHHQSPEAWTSSGGKVVYAVFEAVHGDKVNLLVRKELSQTALSDASRLQLHALLNKDKMPAMDLEGFEVPSIALSIEPSASMDLTAKPDAKLDLTNKKPAKIELDKYKYEEKPSGPKKSSPATKAEETQSQSLQQKEAQAKLLARQQQRAAANDRIVSLLKEFEALYSERGESEMASDEWTKKYDNFIERLEQSRHMDHDDLIAYSALAIAAGAVGRRDHRGVVSSLLMLSEFLVRSR